MGAASEGILGGAGGFGSAQKHCGNFCLYCTERKCINKNLGRGRCVLKAVVLCEDTRAVVCGVMDVALSPPSAAVLEADSKSPHHHLVDFHMSE